MGKDSRRTVTWARPNKSAAYLKECRTTRGLSLADAAKGIGCSVGTLRRYEHEGIHGGIGALRVFAVCWYYGISADALCELAKQPA